jgi:hypothetical protein
MSAAPTTTCQPVLIAGRWRDASTVESFKATDPSRNRPIDREFPVSAWADIDEALDAAAAAATELRRTPPEKIAEFLDAFADLIQSHADELVEAAHQETGLPKSPRLADVELPRTFNQLRLGRGGGSERQLGDAGDRHQGVDPRLLRAARTGLRFRPEQLSVRVRQRQRRRFCRGHRGGQSGDRQGEQLPPRNDPAFRRTGARRRSKRRACRRRPCN